MHVYVYIYKYIYVCAFIYLDKIKNAKKVSMQVQQKKFKNKYAFAVKRYKKCGLGFRRMIYSHLKN